MEAAGGDDLKVLLLESGVFEVTAQVAIFRYLGSRGDWCTIAPLPEGTVGL